MHGWREVTLLGFHASFVWAASTAFVMLDVVGEAEGWVVGFGEPGGGAEFGIGTGFVKPRKEEMFSFILSGGGLAERDGEVEERGGEERERVELRVGEGFPIPKFCGGQRASGRGAKRRVRGVCLSWHKRSSSR